MIPIQTFTLEPGSSATGGPAGSLQEGPPACWWLDSQRHGQDPGVQAKVANCASLGWPKKKTSLRSWRSTEGGSLVGLGGNRARRKCTLEWPTFSMTNTATGIWGKPTSEWKVHWLVTMNPTMGDISKPVFRPQYLESYITMLILYIILYVLYTFNILTVVIHCITLCNICYTIVYTLFNI